MSRCGSAPVAGCQRSGSGPAGIACCSGSAVRYDRHDAFHAYTATCPYCHQVGEYETLQEAVRAGVKHSRVCHEPT